MEGFDGAAEKREAFLKKQKSFKKAWRKELSNLEFAQNDEEASAAVGALYKACARIFVARTHGQLIRNSTPT